MEQVVAIAEGRDVGTRRSPDDALDALWSATREAFAQQRRRWRAAAAVVIALFAVGGCLAAWWGRAALLGAIGSALVAEDSLRPADVAVVSVASVRAAALDAAKLYRRGLVREVWVARWREEPVDRRAAAIGVMVPRTDELARAILERGGVPPSAIVVLDDEVDGLESEMAAVGRRALWWPRVRLTVLTARSHTARARLLLREVYACGARIRTRGVKFDSFDPTAWWRDRGSTREVVLEYVKWAALLARGPWTKF